ncbi:MAG: sigma-70 family RNA polymerase sigma factor [Planctomycetaceae bacterium]|nr:sigma-70 family RNA polymerase sigma factor [Planctomycetaceae bacterium]
MSEPAFSDQLIAQHYGRIRRAAGLLCSCAWDADDLTQETFVRAVEQWHRCRNRDHPETWLYGILMNLDRSRRRRIWRWLRHHTGAARDHLVEGSHDDSRETLSLLWQRVAQLPDSQRQAIVLRFSEGLSHADIAGIMNCQEVSVRTAVHKGLELLRHEFARSEQRCFPEAGTATDLINPLLLDVE